MPLSSIGGAPTVSPSSAASTSPAEQTKIQGSLEQTKNVPGSLNLNQSQPQTIMNSPSNRIMSSEEKDLRHQLREAQANLEKVSGQPSYPNKPSDMMDAMAVLRDCDKALKFYQQYGQVGTKSVINELYKY